MKHKRLPLAISLLLCALAGCAFFSKSLPFYDSITYQNLTDTKPIVLQLYDRFGDESLDTNRIDMVKLKLSQIYEYEKGKGINNNDMVAQVDSMRAMFGRQLNDRLTGGKWNKANTENCKENIAEAFDIAIATEAAKNRKK